jgi:mandelate racemase
MVDYNQALTLAEALKRGRALDTHDILWIEEPITHEDYTSCARLTRALTTPVQIGENYNGPAGLSRALAAGACDLVMPDIARVGGVTGWMQASGIAAAAGIELSSHLMPELSAQLFCATATAHWLEHVDWADAFLKEPMRVVDGKAIPSGRSGTGLEWDEARLQSLETL